MNSPVSRTRITSPQLMLYSLIDSSYIGLLVHPQRKSSFSPQLPEQLSFGIKPGPATLVNGIQCPLRDKILLRPTVSSKNPPATSRTVVLKALHNSSGPPKAARPPKSQLSLFANSSATLSSLSLPTSSLGWDGTILLDLRCNFRVATTRRWSVLRN